MELGYLMEAISIKSQNPEDHMEAELGIEKMTLSIYKHNRDDDININNNYV